jgi:Dolichyl-phosphate-mannose-protein mannosyltransferase
VSETSWFSRIGLPLLVVVLLVVTHGFASPSGEPWKNNDETRHVMTGVFFRDALCDFPASAKDPKGYASRYYTQYPALGLLVWPPFFYAVEGSAMAIFGIDYVVARAVLTGFDLLAAFYLFRLTSRFAGPTVASLSLAIAGLSLLIFEFSRYVLLEMPCLALVLGSIYHFERTLAEYRFRDAMLACLLAAFAALTRFDGIVLAPYFVIRLISTRNFHVLFKPGVIVGVVMALVLTVPYYLFTMQEYGTGLAAAGTTGTSSEATRTGLFAKLVAYPSFILDQVGWAAMFWLLVGLPLAAYRRHPAFGMGFALLAATYITFTPLAELEARHAIYWVPALTLFAAIGLMEFWQAAGAKLGFARWCSPSSARGFNRLGNRVGMSVATRRLPFTPSNTARSIARF